MAIFHWRGKVYSVSVPLMLILAAVVGTVAALLHWLCVW